MRCILEDKTGYENLAATLYNYMVHYSDRNSIRHCLYFVLGINELDGDDALTCVFREDSIYKEKLTEFSKMLYTYNKIAYGERYKEDQDPEDLATFKFGKSKLKSKDAHVHIFKALRFVDYQCSDSEEYRNSSTRTILEKLKAKMGEIAIQSSFSYEEAHWGLS